MAAPTPFGATSGRPPSDASTPAHRASASASSLAVTANRSSAGRGSAAQTTEAARRSQTSSCVASAASSPAACQHQASMPEVGADGAGPRCPKACHAVHARFRHPSQRPPSAMATQVRAARTSATSCGARSARTSGGGRGAGSAGSQRTCPCRSSARSPATSSMRCGSSAVITASSRRRCPFTRPKSPAYSHQQAPSAAQARRRKPASQRWPLMPSRRIVQPAAAFTPRSPRSAAARAGRTT